MHRESGHARLCGCPNHRSRGHASCASLRYVGGAPPSRGQMVADGPVSAAAAREPHLQSLRHDSAARTAMPLNPIGAATTATLTALAWKTAGAIVLWIIGRWLIHFALRVLG